MKYILSDGGDCDGVKVEGFRDIPVGEPTGVARRH